MSKAIKVKSQAKKKSPVNYSDRKKILKRNIRAGFMLNEKENEAVEAYCRKYRIPNKSKFMRETVMRFVMDQFLSDYPTLFDKQDLDRLKINNF